MSKQLSLDIKLRDDATFANYVGQAGIAIKSIHPWTYVWGTPGSGRSHLLQALCHQYDGAIYLSGLDNLSVDVLENLEQMDVICLDDIHEVLGDKEWEEALFHLMNAVKDQGARLYISGNKSILGLEICLADLRSRLIASLSVETDNLDDQQKLQVLMQRAHNRGFRLSEEVGRFILSRSSRDMRQLLGLLQRLEVETLTQGKRLTIPFVKQTLSL